MSLESFFTESEEGHVDGTATVVDNATGVADLPRGVRG